MNIRMIEKYYSKQRKNKSLLFSLVVHAIAIIVIAVWLMRPDVEQIEDSFTADIFHVPQGIHTSKKEVPKVEQGENSSLIKTEAKPVRSPIPPIGQTEDTSKLEPPSLSTVVDLLPSPESILKLSDKSPTIKKGSGEIEREDTFRYSENSRQDVSQQSADSNLDNLTQSSGTGQDAFGGEVSDTIGGYEDAIGDKLGSVIDEADGIVRGHIRLIRLKHAMSDWWQDPTAIPSLIKWLREHTPTITADIDYEGGALPLTDKHIMEAPLLIMTGHDQAMSGSYERLAERNSQASGFSEVERASLRKYILDHNGMLFFDYCGNGGNEKSFAILVQTELRTVFPEYPMETLSIQHEIFQCHFKLEKTPVGGSTFWGTSYKGGNNRWRYIKGISVPGRLGKPRLAVVFCPLDYLCSMETAEIDSRAPLSARRSSDVYRFMTNMFIYQMRQRATNK